MEIPIELWITGGIALLALFANLVVSIWSLVLQKKTERSQRADVIAEQKYNDFITAQKTMIEAYFEPDLTLLSDPNDAEKVFELGIQAIRRDEKTIRVFQTLKTYLISEEIFDELVEAFHKISDRIEGLKIRLAKAKVNPPVTRDDNTELQGILSEFAAISNNFNALLEEAIDDELRKLNEFRVRHLREEMARRNKSKIGRVR